MAKKKVLEISRSPTPIPLKKTKDGSRCSSTNTTSDINTVFPAIRGAGPRPTSTEKHAAPSKDWAKSSRRYLHRLATPERLAELNPYDPEAHINQRTDTPFIASGHKPVNRPLRLKKMEASGFQDRASDMVTPPPLASGTSGSSLRLYQRRNAVTELEVATNIRERAAPSKRTRSKAVKENRKPKESQPKKRNLPHNQRLTPSISKESVHHGGESADVLAQGSLTNINMLPEVQLPGQHSQHNNSGIGPWPIQNNYRASHHNLDLPTHSCLGESRPAAANQQAGHIHHGAAAANQQVGHIHHNAAAANQQAGHIHHGAAAANQNPGQSNFLISQSNGDVPDDDFWHDLGFACQEEI